MLICFDTFGSGNAVNADWAKVEVFNHIPGGGNVLYMDAHVQFVKYRRYPNENWPLTEFLGILRLVGDESQPQRRRSASCLSGVVLERACGVGHAGIGCLPPHSKKALFLIREAPHGATTSGERLRGAARLVVRP